MCPLEKRPETRNDWHKIMAYAWCFSNAQKPEKKPAPELDYNWKLEYEDDANDIDDDDEFTI